MPRRMYDFKCDNGHATEKFIDVDTHTIHCSICGGLSRRQLSSPTIPVGVMGANWATDRAKKQAKEKA